MNGKRLDQMISQTAGRFLQAGIETARLDSRLLVGHALGLSDTDIILQFDRPLSDEEANRVETLVLRRLKREPIAHILGVREFWGLPFHVTPDTLVPRPDSETLVAGVLERVADKSAALQLVDIGTGSGCLLLSLLSELPNAYGVGVDISEGALCVARQNAADLGFSERCDFVLANYADAIGGRVDILLSNPPYLAEAEMADLETDVAEFDPYDALVSGPDGLEAYRAIFDTVAKWSDLPDLMAFEFGYKQSKSIASLAKDRFLIEKSTPEMEILQDLGGRDRVLMLDFRAK